MVTKKKIDTIVDEDELDEDEVGEDELDAINELSHTAMVASEPPELSEASADEGEVGALPTSADSVGEVNESGDDVNINGEVESDESVTPLSSSYTIHPRWINASDEALRREINGWSHIEKLPDEVNLSHQQLCEYLGYLNHCGMMAVNPFSWLGYSEYFVDHLTDEQGGEAEDNE